VAPILDQVNATDGATGNAMRKPEPTLGSISIVPVQPEELGMLCGETRSRPHEDRVRSPTAAGRTFQFLNGEGACH